MRMREINYPIWLPVGPSVKFSQILEFMTGMMVHLVTFRRDAGPLCQRVGRNQEGGVADCCTQTRAVRSLAARCRQQNFRNAGTIKQPARA